MVRWGKVRLLGDEMNKLTIGLIAILILIGAYLGYDAGRDAQRQKVWNEREKVLDSQLKAKDALIKAKDGELLASESRNALWELNVKRLDEEIEQLRRDNAQIKRTLAEREAQLRQLPPEDVVAQLQKTLDSREIWLEENAVKFSIPVAVEAMVRLDRERKLTLEYVPGIEKENVKLTAEVKELKELTAGKDVTIGLWTDKYNLLSGKYDVLDKKFSEYKKLKEKSTFAKIIDFTLKVGGGMMAGYLLGSSK